MLDIKKIRSNIKEIEGKLKTRDQELSLNTIKVLDEEIREIISEEQELQNLRNTLSKDIGEKKAKKADASKEVARVQEMKERLEFLKNQRMQKEEELNFFLFSLPNIPQDDVPISLDPKDNVCIKTHLEKRKFSFTPKNHLELGQRLKLFDFERGTKIAGSNWPCYTGIGARLEWALINYMVDLQEKNGFTFILPPILVKKEIAFGSGQLPKFENQLYKVEEKDSPLYIVPTAEIALCGLHYDEILQEEELPKKYCSYTPCFRREAGAAGKQERGLIRMHQFNKVELFAFTKPEESNKTFQEIVVCAEEVLKGLNLHYRNMLLVTGDISHASSKTIDIEVYLPGQERYYEVSSVSNCTDYQARRSNIRYKVGQEKPQFVHTLNGSGLATSRLMVAILENNQNEDGSINIPTVLQKYLEDPISVLKPK